MRGYIACYLRKSQYGTLFYEYLLRSGILGNQIIMFTKDLDVEKFLVEHKIELLILEEKAGLSEHILEQINRIVILSENELCNRKEGEIYKYQSMDSILEQLKVLQDQSFNRSVEKISLSSRECNVLAIIPIVQSIGSIELVSLFASIFGAEGKTCCLNLSSLDSFYDVFQEQVQRGLSDLIFYGRQNGLTSERIKEAIISYHGIDYIPTVEHGLDLCEISEVEAKMIQTMIDIELRYTYLVIGVETYTKVAEYYFRESKSIYLLCEDTSLCRRELKNWQRLLASSSSDRGDKLVPIILPSEIVGQVQLGASALKNKTLNQYLIKNYEIREMSLGLE